MKKLVRSSILFAAILALMLLPMKTEVFARGASDGISINKTICEFKMDERRLWMDHLLWTRSYIVSDLASLADKGAVLERLLKNQDDIGNSFKPYYGDEVGNKLSVLLREHIEIAGQVIDAKKKGNKTNYEKYNKLWYENADKIVAFLSSVNPNYSEKGLKEMFYIHLQLIIDEVAARIEKEWATDIEIFDEAEEHMIMFSDLLVDGVIKHYPQKFK